jgi:putative transposase
MSRLRKSRSSMRLPDFDYTSPGAYFITLIAHNRKMLFGDVVNGVMVLNDLGRIVEKEWENSIEIRIPWEFPIHVTMPNHFHGIVRIVEESGQIIHPLPVAGHSCAPLQKGERRPLYRFPRSLGSFVAGFKSACTVKINTFRGTHGTPVWERDYYERIIEFEEQADSLYGYIEGNPSNWVKDDLYHSN